MPKKVSYDVHKDGVKVAVLTFTKQAWRLGETVVGVVEVNERSGRGRVLKVCVFVFHISSYAWPSYSSGFCMYHHTTLLTN